MKKYLIISAFILVLVMTAGIISAGAAGEIVPYNYAEYGQKTNYVDAGGAAPSIDGVIADGEYYNSLVFDKNTPGVSFSSDTFTGYPSEIKVGITADNDYIYLGITVNEPFYKYRVGSTSGSYMAFSFGFNMGDTFYQCMDRQTLTLSVYDDKKPFFANTIMVYDVSGKAATTYNANIYLETALTRDDTNNLTTYEVKLGKTELAADAGLTKLPDVFYIHFINKTFDSAGNSGEFRYRCILDDTMKAIITAQDGWCASFAPHILSFLAPSTETTAAPLTTTAPVVTTAPITTAPVTTAPVTTAKVTTAAVTTTNAPETTAVSAETTAATTAPAKDKGCGSVATFALLPILLAVIPAIRRKKV